MFAIIETGGKQYKVAEGDSIRVELLDSEVGSMMEIDKVLAIFDGKKLKTGKPYIKNATVACKVVEHGKGKKIVVFRYKAKKNIRTKNGHRQPYTKLQIDSIETKAKSVVKAKATPETDVATETESA